MPGVDRTDVRKGGGETSRREVNRVREAAAGIAEAVVSGEGAAGRLDLSSSEYQARAVASAEATRVMSDLQLAHLALGFSRLRGIKARGWVSDATAGMTGIWNNGPKAVVEQAAYDPRVLQTFRWWNHLWNEVSGTRFTRGEMTLAENALGDYQARTKDVAKNDALEGVMGQWMSLRGAMDDVARSTRPSLTLVKELAASLMARLPGAFLGEGLSAIRAELEKPDATKQDVLDAVKAHAPVMTVAEWALLAVAFATARPWVAATDVDHSEPAQGVAELLQTPRVVEEILKDLLDAPLAAGFVRERLFGLKIRDEGRRAAFVGGDPLTPSAVLASEGDWYVRPYRPNHRDLHFGDIVAEMDRATFLAPRIEAYRHRVEATHRPGGEQHRNIWRDIVPASSLWASVADARAAEDYVRATRTVHPDLWLEGARLWLDASRAVTKRGIEGVGEPVWDSVTESTRTYMAAVVQKLRDIPADSMERFMRHVGDGVVEGGMIEAFPEMLGDIRDLSERVAGDGQERVATAMEKIATRWLMNHLDMTVLREIRLENPAAAKTAWNAWVAVAVAQPHGVDRSIMTRMRHVLQPLQKDGWKSFKRDVGRGLRGLRALEKSN